MYLFQREGHAERKRSNWSGEKPVKIGGRPREMCITCDRRQSAVTFDCL